MGEGYEGLGNYRLGRYMLQIVARERVGMESNEQPTTFNK
jgi:hypothetical protein